MLTLPLLRHNFLHLFRAVTCGCARPQCLRETTNLQLVSDQLHDLPNITRRKGCRRLNDSNGRLLRSAPSQ